MLKMKSKREAASSKRNKSVGKKTKTRVDATKLKSKGKAKHRIHRSGTTSKQTESATTNGTNGLQSMTAYEYYVQCRANSEEVLSNSQIDNMMRGPYSRKRMKALRAIKKQQRTPATNTYSKSKQVETNTPIMMNQLMEGVEDTDSDENDDDEQEGVEDTISDENDDDEQEVEELPNDVVDDEDTNESTDDSPQFFNSFNSRQVLLLLKTKIYFHGALKVRLLAGEVCIFGYAMQENETVTANSPRGHSFLYLSPSPQRQNSESETTRPLEQLQIQLRKLSTTFLRADLQEIISNFNSSTDAVVLLENDHSKSIFMIENYMKEAVFPNMNALISRPYQQSELILRSQFLPHSANGVKINSQWKDISMTAYSRHVIIGGKGVGKSTFLRYFINRNLTEFKKILLIDLDIGQPEMFLPQTISATVINEPILGPGYLRNKSPHKSFLFGDVNVLVSPIKYLKCALKLLEHCCSVDELKSMPWVVNTMGYNRGFGLELIVGILRKLKPTDLVQIQAHRSIDNFDKTLNADEVNNFRFNFFNEEVKDVVGDCTYSTHICNTMSLSTQKRFWEITPKDLRFVMILSKLGNVLQGNAKWITDVKPVCASTKDLKIIVVNDDSLTAEAQVEAINGNLVYLCQSNVNDPDDILECYGLGIVRSVETVSNKLYLLPSISKADLQHVNTLAICSMPLPTSVLINQSRKISGCIPYAYASDNFIGSKQIMPTTYRPDRQTPRSSTKSV